MNLLSQALSMEWWQGLIFKTTSVLYFNGSFFLPPDIVKASFCLWNQNLKKFHAVDVLYFSAYKRMFYMSFVITFMISYHTEVYKPLPNYCHQTIKNTGMPIFFILGKNYLKEICLFLGKLLHRIYLYTFLQDVPKMNAYS